MHHSYTALVSWGLGVNCLEGEKMEGLDGEEIEGLEGEEIGHIHNRLNGRVLTPQNAHYLQHVNWATRAEMTYHPGGHSFQWCHSGTVSRTKS